MKLANLFGNRLVAMLLLLIVGLAFLLRFYQLGKNPPGINLDEAAIGYNAYSILKTGKDEYGQPFPLAFRSLDDYKPPLYIYLTIPAVALFGETEFAVRLPSAILGVGAVIMVFFLACELFPKSHPAVPLLVAFLLAISPWHLQFTRTAYETGSLAFFTTGGLLFFLKGLTKARYFILAAMFWGLELYLYQAAKVFVPLFVVGTILIYLSLARKRFVALIAFFFALGIFALPMVALSLNAAGQIRFLGTSIFQDPKAHADNLTFQIQDWLRRDRISAEYLHPENFAYSDEILRGYFSHLAPGFFYVGSNGPKVTYAPRVGLEYLWELPFLVAGFYFLYSRSDKKPALLLSLWFLLSPLPASVTTGLPSSIRTAIFLPSLQMITAIGVINLLTAARQTFGRKTQLLATIISAVGLYSFYFYLHMLFFHAPIVNSKVWYYGYRSLVTQVARLAPQYNKVLVANDLDQPLNFFLFFLKYDPATFLKVDGGRVSGGFAEDQNHFAKYYFRHFLEYGKYRNQPGILFVGQPNDFPSDAKVLEKFFYLDGQPSAYIVASDQ